MDMDLHKMSLKDLRELQTQVGKAITGFEERRKKDALAELEDKAKAMGFTLSDLMAATQTKKRAAAVPKYANPANRSDTWSGRGRKPRWFVAALDAGKEPESMEV